MGKALILLALCLSVTACGAKGPPKQRPSSAEVKPAELITEAVTVVDDTGQDADPAVQG